jgi:hypothetical protein
VTPEETSDAADVRPPLRNTDVSPVRPTDNGRAEASKPARVPNGFLVSAPLPVPDRLPAHHSLRLRLPFVISVLIAAVVALFLRAAHREVEATLVGAASERARFADRRVADTYDAITTDRPYRPARPPALAFEELGLEVTRGLRRPDLVEAFIALCGNGEPTCVSTVGTGRL